MHAVRGLSAYVGAMAAVLVLVAGACVGSDPDPSSEIGQPCGAGCAAGLACVDSVCRDATGVDAAPSADGAANGDAGAGDAGGGDAGAVDSGVDAQSSCRLTVPPDSTGVTCAGKRCTSPERCCTPLAGGNVECSAQCTYRGTELLLACDSPGDCPAEVCCLLQTTVTPGCAATLSHDPDASVNPTFAVTTACRAAAQCAIRVCSKQGDCAGGQICVPARLPGLTTLIGVCQDP